MASTRKQLRTQIRSALGDFPTNQAVLAALVNASTETFTFAAGEEAHFKLNSDLEIESEVCHIRDINTTAHSLTVTRGYFGSTAAQHALGTVCSALHIFSDFELNVLFNQAVRSLWPRVWFERQVVHSALTNASVLDYTLAQTHIIEVEIESGTDSGKYYPLRMIELARILSETNTWATIIRFHAYPPGNRRLRYRYAAKVPLPATDTEEIWAEDLIPGLSQYLVFQTAALASAALQGRRAHYAQYSTAVEERVGDVDMMIRNRFAFQNSADVLMSQIARPLPPPWPTRRRR